jgi:amidase
MARDVAGLVRGMALLEPGFAVAERSDLTIGRLRPRSDPLVDAGVDAALAATEWSVDELALPEWDAATAAAGLLLVVEAWATNRDLVGRDPAGISDGVRERLQSGDSFSPATVASAWEGQRKWTDTLNRLFTRFDFLVTPTLAIFPPTLEDANELIVARCTLPVNLAGVPALSIPVPTTGPLPASIQLIGPVGSEERLLAAGAWLEAAARSGRGG